MLGKGDAIEETGKESALCSPALHGYHAGFAKAKEEHTMEPEMMRTQTGVLSKSPA